MRVKRGVKARRRRNRIFQLAKGFRGRSKNTIRQARARVEKAMVYAYAGRREKKRDYRNLWVVRINAAARICELSYSKFMGGVIKAGVKIDRKILADLGAKEPQVFAAIATLAKNNLPQNTQVKITELKSNPAA